MFHKITPRIKGTTGLWRGPTGTVQICPPQLQRFPPGAADTAVQRIIVDPYLQNALGNNYGQWITGGFDSWTQFVQGAPNSGQSFGLLVNAGTTSGDVAMQVSSANSATNFMQLVGDGSGFIGWNSTANQHAISFAANGAVTIQASDNTVSVTVNDSAPTQGIIGLKLSHGGTSRGFIGTGPATMTGAALADFGIVAAGGELSAGLNGTGIGVLPATWWIRQNANHTLTSQTAAQAIFNTTANGTLTLPAGVYEFECFVPLSGMSATSGSFGFAVGGTASPLSVWWSIASKLGTAAATPEAVQWTYNLQSNANTALATASTATTGFMLCRGFFACSAGTIIPQVSLGVAAAATAAAGAYFWCRLMSQSGSRTSFGPWT